MTRNPLFHIAPALLLALTIASGCSMRNVEHEEKPEESDSQKMENLNAALSRAQSRIEELDARLSALTDKVDSTKTTLDNITGNKPIKTETVGDLATREDERAKEHDEARAKHVAPSPGDEVVSAFHKAMTTFKSGKYSDAELQFNKFTESYPEDILAGSAQFYAGESYFMMGEYRLALNEYNKVLSSFSSSPRVASALVRIVHCQDALGNKEGSKKAFNLAQTLFEGNPSLDWPAPSSGGGKPEKTELNASPIEPASQKNPGNDDEKLDQVESAHPETTPAH